MTNPFEIISSKLDYIEALLLDRNYPTPKTETEEKIMTRNEVCELLNITKSTLWKRTKTGKLQSYGQGRRVYYKRSEVLKSLTPLKK